MQNQPENELMRLNEVMEAVPYSRASIYRLMKENKFPKSITMGGRSVFWVRTQIQAFIREQIDKAKEEAA
ncbi:AlpA family phage regulatory protein [Idiomarina sp. Sol25]|uniref:helix-turn-helix transcriptional regulator n=1 Tax=Idiomarina sp. Sol25 TaxID=3064000 RepID=UPI00294AF9E0|nr:AlpA family phage regulatory protein [Idiomarina sp. Sol25]MDV6328808.1 AlpA family phage regulatory protein [Idiomarina sp. Sol25]